MNNDDTRYSVPAVWSQYYSELQGTPWDDYDLDPYRFWHNDPSDVAPAVNAMKHVYDLAKDWKGADPEDAVLAVLKAAHRYHNSIFLTPNQVKEMAGNFAVVYASMHAPLQDYLDDHYNGISWDWLNTAGQTQIDQAVVRDSEIWVNSEHLPGVWVFNKPGV
jgi:hypothetical protein